MAGGGNQTAFYKQPVKIYDWVYYFLIDQVLSIHTSLVIANCPVGGI